jgi:hypothetical protein
MLKALRLKFNGSFAKEHGYGHEFVKNFYKTIT